MQKSFIRVYTKKIIVTLQVLLLLCFLLSCILPFLPIDKFWWGGFLGIAMPYCTLLILLSCLFWLIVKPRLVLLCIFCLLLGFKQISVQFAFNFSNNFELKKQDSCLRFISWNIENFNGLVKKSNQRRIVKDEILNTLNDLKADVVCLQEFNSSPQNNHVTLLKTIFKYGYFAPDYGEKGEYEGGNAIFSKFPIINTNQHTYKIGESVIYVDILKGKDTLRIFTTHLESYKFNKENYSDIEKIKQKDIQNITPYKGIAKKMKEAFKKRGTQTAELIEVLNANKYPSILCGDFNDVPNNYTYWQLKHNRQDAFLKKGYGIGKSYLGLAPTLRIDYILPDYNFEVKQFDLIDEGLSDHAILVADLKIKQ